MGKFFLIALAFALLFVSLLSNLVSANADIAYIVKDTAKPEINVVNAIKELGYSYDLIDDDKLPINFSNYEMIVVWDELLKNKDKIPVTEKKSLVANTYYLEDWKIAKYTGSQVSTGYTYVKMMVDNRITREMKSEVKAYDSTNVEVYYLPHKPKRALGIENVVAVKVGLYDMPVIAVIDKGKSLYGGGNAKERTAFFGITKADRWTADSKQLFKNTIEWVMAGDDADSDGFYDDEDCDDKNYLIHPLAEEIAYNGIDENCDGKDLRDVDKDGYDADIVGGNDCDDSDADVNPASEDIYKNCKNDAPIVAEIGKLTVYETEEVVIEISATDPEDDSVSYSINDSRFSQDENVFTWQTEYDDEGTYYFKVSVSDGSLSTENEVKVEVKNTNRAPICNEIPSLEWDEDGTASLNLNNYCYDPDGASLNFYVNETSSNEGIILESLENGTAIFSAEKDWNGEDWIIFKISDGKDSALTNKIMLIVHHNNDPPILVESLEDITWSEDTNLLSYLNLNNYFYDVDSVLNYGVIGNYFIDIQINNSIISFYPEKDWYGEETVVFSASDEEFSVYSNAITLKVLNVNEPPEFAEMDCQLNINEDTEYSCELNASDFENDEIVFSIVNENNLKCDIKGANLNYVSYKDYNGLASCLIRAKDAYAYTDYLLEVDVLPINDAPVIVVEPKTSHVRIIEGKSKLFSVSASDVEADTIEITWFLDSENVGSGNSYLFNKTKGNYNLEVIASDGAEEASYLWNVLVGSISDFTCREVEGYLCEKNEVCLGELFGVKDTDGCCSVTCSPKFGDIDRCEALNEKISIEIKESDDGDNFKIGETVGIEVKIKNNAEDDLDFDVEAYFYDLTEDETIEDDEDSVGVDKGDSEEAKFEFDVPFDIDEKNEYAIFIKAIDDEESCNERYVKIGINRKKENVIIQDVNIEEASCGDYIDTDVKVKNIGSKDQDVVIKIENSELNISEKSEEFELEEYDKKDEAIKKFKIKIPDEADAGNYTLKITASFNGEEVLSTEELILGECRVVEKKLTETEKISLKGEKKEVEEKVKDNLSGIILLVISMIIVIIAIIYLVYLILIS